MDRTKLEIFKELFRGRDDIYGRTVGDDNRCAKQALSDQVIIKHIKAGTMHLGVYPLMKDNSSHWAVIDFDHWQYEDVRMVEGEFRRQGIVGYVEVSRSKGFHLWFFFDRPIQAVKSRQVVRQIMAQIAKGKSYEVFPKQDCLQNGSFGNYIRLPLFHPLTKQGKTVFLDSDGKPYPDQWQLLRSIEKVNEGALDRIVSLGQNTPVTVRPEPTEQGSGSAQYGLPCVQKLLQGVDEGVRNKAALKLAKHLRDASLPQEKVLELMLEWDGKNRLELGESVIRSKVSAVFEKGYKGFDCDDPDIQKMCEPSCRIYQRKNMHKEALGELKEMVPAQDFINGKAFIAVPIKALREGRMMTSISLISSDREKIELNETNLISLGFYTERNPNTLTRWSLASMEAFLKGEYNADVCVTFNAIKNIFDQYMDFGDKRWSTFMACWVTGTHFHRIFESYPYIHLNGNMDSGKTKTLMLVAAMSFNGELTFNSTPAYVVRVIHDNNSVCCIDEAERLKVSRDQDTQVMVGMLNAGYKKGSYCGKLEQGNNGKWHLKKYEAYSPKIFASIRGLEPSLASRCVPIIMVKTNNIEIRNREIPTNDQTFQQIRDQLYTVGLSYHQQVERIYREVSHAELLGREWELWKPLFCIAKVVDLNSKGETQIFDEIGQLALETQSSKREASLEDIVAPKLLQLLKEMIAIRPREDKFYSMAEISQYLFASGEDSFKWLGDDNKQGQGKWVGQEMRKAGIVNGRAKQKKVDGVNTRGYYLETRIIEDRLKSYDL